MTHWGWYWKIKKKHIARKLCSTFTTIDSFRLYKNNVIMGFTVAPLEVKAEAQSNSLKITYRRRKEHSYRIPVDRLPCNYGGFRCYFRCLVCNKRARLLYFAEHSLFLCRKCLNLSYDSQRLRPTKRYEYASDKLKAFIKQEGGDLDQHKKPPRMRHAIYEKLKQKQCYYECKSWYELNKELRDWYGSKVEPYLENEFDCTLERQC